MIEAARPAESEPSSGDRSTRPPVLHVTTEQFRELLVSRRKLARVPGQPLRLYDQREGTLFVLERGEPRLPGIASTPGGAG